MKMLVSAAAALALTATTALAADLKVGMITTLSGGGASLGIDVRDGFNLAVKQSGMDIEVIVEDDQASSLFDRFAVIDEYRPDHTFDLGRDLGRQIRTGRAVRDVERTANRLATRLRDDRRGLRRPFGIDVGGHHARAFRSVPLGDRPADPGTRAGHHGDMAF